MNNNSELPIKYLSSHRDCLMADEWFDHADGEHFWMKWRFDIIRKLLSKDCKLGDVLEVGCGSGVVRQQIEEYYVCPVHGCDLNLAALQKAKAGRGDLFCYDINQRNIDMKSHFSTIFLLDVLEHIDEQSEFLQSVNYHLKDEGRLVLTVPAHKSLFSKYDVVAGHLRRYSIPEINGELRKCGFIMEKGCYWGMSLLPVIMLRNLLLSFVKKNNVIKIGFQPQHFMIEGVLQAMRRLECAFFQKVPFGVSIALIARKLRDVGTGSM